MTFLLATARNLTPDPFRFAAAFGGPEERGDGSWKTADLSEVKIKTCFGAAAGLAPPRIPSFFLSPFSFFLTASLLVLLLAPASAPAQSDTLVPPSPAATAPVPDSLLTLQEINQGPRRALLWAAIPGGGQVYNKRWWKVPLVYAGLLGTIAAVDFNQTRYSRFVNALRDRCLGEGNVAVPPFADCQPTFNDVPQQISNDALIRARDAADRNRQTAYIGILAVYLLQAVEAYTDAHLQEFDISDDLGLHIGSTPGGVGIALRF